MALNSYAALKIAVTDWVARMDSKLVAHVDDFITLAEVRIWDRVRLRAGLLQNQTLTVLAGQSTAALPSDFLGLHRIEGAGLPRMVYTSPDVLLDDDYAQTGSQTDYSIEGTQFILGAAPDADTYLTYSYYKRPAALSGASDADLWLLLARPNIYLYAALLEAAIFMKEGGGKDQTGKYGSLLDKAIADANMADNAAKWPRGQRLQMRRVGALR